MVIDAAAVWREEREGVYVSSNFLIRRTIDFTECKQKHGFISCELYVASDMHLFFFFFLLLLLLMGMTHQGS
jgi:hypothetical protein